MSENPYAAPKAKVADASQASLPPSTALAGQGARIANFLLDTFLAWLFAALCGFVLGAALGALGNTTWFRNPVGVQLVALAFFTAYYVVFEATFGWTLAKLMTRTRVVDEEGRTPAFMKVLGRSLARSVPFEPFSFLGKTGIGWHDRWSGTRVVSLRRRSGPTLAESFQRDFGTRLPEHARAQAAATGPAWTPSDGPPAWCPNCERQIAATAPRCAGCGADFTSPDGWKPLAERP
jgi:uncharacterized RDD family membrane protein YckC